MNQKYTIRIWQDNIYAVYRIDDGYYMDYIFKGSLEEVNAWLSLKEKGFDL